MMGRPVGPFERKVLGLPTRDGGIGIIPPTAVKEARDPAAAFK